MSAEDLARGLRAIDDEDVRRRVAAGDLAAAGEFDLTDEERRLLQGAADDYPEVAGFAFDAFITLDPDPQGNLAAKFAPPAYGEAVQYIQGGGGKVY